MTFEKKIDEAALDDAQNAVREKCEALRERRKALEALRGQVILSHMNELRVLELENSIAELLADPEVASALETTDTEKRSEGMDPIKQLEIIEKAVGNATVEPARLRKSAEAIYDDVVARIQKSEQCDARRAHYLASQDPIGKRAYTQVVELQDRERTARDGAGRIGAFLG